MSIQAFATGRSVLGGPFVVTVALQPEPVTPTVMQWALLDAIAQDWIGDPADDVSCVDYLHERDDDEVGHESMG